MRIGWMLVALLLMSRDSAAEGVTVYFGAKGTALTSGAVRIASTVFQRAGVEIAWRDAGRHPSGVPRTWLRIELVDGPSSQRPPGVLAVSYPYAGCSKSITVFLDRVRSLAHGTNRESALLAYVLVHEITHVIQGVNRHSPAGVMKAHWSEEDRAAIFERRLGFDEPDLWLMRRGLAAGWCGRAASLTNRSESGIGFRPE